MGNSCSTVVEQMHGSDEVVGSKPVGSWDFFFLNLASFIQLKNYQNPIPRNGFQNDGNRLKASDDFIFRLQQLRRLISNCSTDAIPMLFK